jgi:Toprim-like
MNIEQAKAIPISVILDKLNLTPQRTSGHKQLYFSPFRNEKTASFWVDTKTNLWCDFGDSKWKGGDGIHLVRAYLDSENENCAVTDALRWLKNMTGFVPAIKAVADPDDTPTETTLILKHTGKLVNEKLIEYGLSRGIPKTLMVSYFGQSLIYNAKSQKKFYALSMRNELKGHELRNPYFKGCIGKKYITFMRGTVSKPTSIHVFEGAFDYLSVIAQENGQLLKDDAIILHSLSNLNKATAYIRNYGYRNCFTWMDNDQPGLEAVEAWEAFCKTEENLLHVPMNSFYAPSKDVNAAHMAKLEL